MIPRTWKDGTDRLRPGDIILWDGTGLIPSGAIKLYEDSPFSHCSMVFEPALLPATMPLSITESTILNGRSGPQLNALFESRLAHFEAKGRAWAFLLSDAIRLELNFPAMWSLALSKMTTDHYDIDGLAKFILARIPVAKDMGSLYRTDANAEVCSTYVAELLVAGGATHLGLTPSLTDPERIASLPIYSSVVQLAGTSIPLPDLTKG